MNIETLARKLEPLRPEIVQRWRESRALVDIELKTLLDQELTFTARRYLGEYWNKLLLSLPPPTTARGQLHLGTILYEQAKWPFGLQPEELLQGLAIFGRSGAGKTNVVFHLLRQFDQRRIVYLFLDWKRTARHLLPHLKHKPMLYTPGRSLAPLVFNPFLPPPNIEPPQYAQQITDLLGSAYTLGDGAKSLIQKALVSILGEGNHQPTASELVRRVRGEDLKGRAAMWCVSAIRALESLDLAGLGGATTATQASLVSGFLEQSTVIELDALNDNAKRFLVPALFSWLYAVQLATSRREELRLVVIVEEAHHVLYRSEHRSRETVMATLLRQCREIGIGVVVVDQHPHLIASPALGNTYTTICLNQKDPADLEKAARLCLLSVEEKRWLSRLPVGQAVVKMQDRWREPFLLEIPHVTVEKGAVSDAAFKQANTGIPTGSGLSPSITGKGNGFGQVLVGDQPLDPAALSLISDVISHPDDGVKVRYRRLALSMERGTRIKDMLVRDGWLEAQIVPVGRSRTVLLRLSSGASKALSVHGTATRESIAHAYWKRRIASEYEQRGYRVVIEAPRLKPATGNVDVLAIRNGERVAIEIETGESNVVENVRQNLRAEYERIVIVPTDSWAASSVERQLARAGLLIPGRVTIRRAV